RRAKDSRKCSATLPTFGANSFPVRFRFIRSKISVRLRLGRTVFVIKKTAKMTAEIFHSSWCGAKAPIHGKSHASLATDIRRFGVLTGGPLLIELALWGQEACFDFVGPTGAGNPSARLRWIDFKPGLNGCFRFAVAHSAITDRRGPLNRGLWVNGSDTTCESAHGCIAR